MIVVVFFGWMSLEVWYVTDMVCVFFVDMLRLSSKKFKK